MRLVIISAIALAYLLNSPILQYVYDVTDYYQYVEFVKIRSRVYECMFLLSFWLVYLQSSKIVKSIACGMMIMIAGSVVDKLLFGITNYLYTDIILAVIAIVISIKVYVREIR